MWLRRWSPASEHLLAPVSDRNRLEARTDSEVPKDAADVVANRLDAQVHLIRNLLARAALADQRQDLRLARRQVRMRRARSLILFHGRRSSTLCGTATPHPSHRPKCTRPPRPGLPRMATRSTSPRLGSTRRPVSRQERQPRSVPPTTPRRNRSTRGRTRHQVTAPGWRHRLGWWPPLRCSFSL